MVIIIPLFFFLVSTHPWPIHLVFFLLLAVISCYFCCLSRNWTMQMVRSAREGPAPSRRTACHHVPPSRRFTPCPSETCPKVLHCRMQQVTISEQLFCSSIWVVVFGSVAWFADVEPLKDSKCSSSCHWSGNCDGRKMCFCAKSRTIWL